MTIPRISVKKHSGTSFAVEGNLEDKKKSSFGKASTTTAPTTTQSPPISSVPSTTTVASTTTEAPAANLAPKPQVAPDSAAAHSVTFLAPSVPAPIQEADVYGQAESNLVAGNNFEEAMQILDMGGGTGDRDTVIRDLLAAFNNPERAVDYLYSDPPTGSVPPTTTVTSTTTEAPAANLALALSVPAPIFLPNDLIISLLDKVSFLTLVKCTVVSKEWNQLIRENQKYLCFSDDAQSWYFSIHKQRGMGTTAQLAIYNHQRKEFNVTANHKLPQIQSQLPCNRRFEIPSCLNQLLGEVNGLVAIGSLERRNVVDPLMILNPVHGTFVELPRLKEKYTKAYRCAIGFGFIRKKEQYMLIRIMFRVNYRDRIQARCFTFKVGSSEKWDFKGLLPGWFSDFLYHGVAIDEDVYFLDINGKIISFNVEAERFSEMQPPPVEIGVNDKSSVSLGKLNNNLCVVKLDFLRNQTFLFTRIDDVWKVFRYRNRSPFTLRKHSLVGLPIIGSIIWLIDDEQLVFQDLILGKPYFIGDCSRKDIEFIHYTPNCPRKYEKGFSSTVDEKRRVFQAL